MSGSEMSFLGHLEELRRRVIISGIAILAAACISFALADPLLELLLLPSGGIHLRAFGILDGLLIKIRIALIVGTALAFPVWAYEAMSFVAPALHAAEKRTLPVLLSAALALFAAGTAFGYSILGTMIQVLRGLFPASIEYFPSASDYISFVLFFLLACGVSFELPIALILLVQLRVLRADALRTRRKTAWFILFVFAEIITPVTDPIVAPLTVLVPLVVLYEGGLFIAHRLEVRRGAGRTEGLSPPEGPR